MIPVRLKMHNFMCYLGETPPFDFRGIHTACICGSNGAGKSTLIDAITWALWGKTRAKSDDDLIYLGEESTTVTFDFSVSNNIYHVVRKHAKPKRQSASGQSSLDLYIRSGENLTTITADTKTQTQQKIIDILHLDYETFINSAFIRQGHAAEFTEQRPAKRKEVLASILELSQYDALEESAKETSRGFELEKERLLSLNKDIEDELETLPSTKEEIKSAKERVALLGKESAKREEEVLIARKDVEALNAKNEQLQNALEYISQIIADKSRWLEIKTHAEARIKEYKELLSKKAEIEKGYKEYLEMRSLSEELYDKQRKFSQFNQKRHEFTMAIDSARLKLEGEAGNINYKIDSLSKNTVSAESKQKELEKFIKAKELLPEQDAHISGEKTKLQILRDETSKLAAEINSLRKENEVTDEKCRLLSTEASSNCPVCEKPLDEEEKLKVIKRYEEEKNKGFIKLMKYLQ